VQTLFTEIAANTSTGSAVFVDLLTLVPVVTAGNRLVIHTTFAASVSLVSPATAFFRLTLDGVALRGAGMDLTVLAEPECGAIVYRTGALAAGAHTVKLQWRGSVLALGLQIRPVTVPDGEHGSLYIEEVSV
jgi:hypothetical protein